MNQTPVIVIAPQASPCSDFGKEDQAGSHAEGLTRTLKSILKNPVLPSVFNVPADVPASKHKWEFMNKYRVLFARGWRGLRVQSMHSITL
jgi:hypothetical protein